MPVPVLYFSTPLWSELIEVAVFLGSLGQMLDVSDPDLEIF
jgi:hypothetical protein